MLCKMNIMALAEAGFNFIVGSRLQKISYETAEYQKARDLIDLQIVTGHNGGYGGNCQYLAK